MSVRTSTAVKALLETLGLGVPVFAGPVPPGKVPPFIAVAELPTPALPESHGDFGDPAADEAVTELAQVDIVQRIRGGDGKAADDPALPDRVAAGLRGARLTTAPWHVYGVQLDGLGPRQETGPNTVQTSVTIRIRRALRRS